jgi:hypothetical protein
MFLHNLLNVLVQTSNRMGLQKRGGNEHNKRKQYRGMWATGHTAKQTRLVCAGSHFTFPFKNVFVIWLEMTRSCHPQAPNSICLSQHYFLLKFDHQAGCIRCIKRTHLILPHTGTRDLRVFCLLNYWLPFISVLYSRLQLTVFIAWMPFIKLSVNLIFERPTGLEAISFHLYIL